MKSIESMKQEIHGTVENSGGFYEKHGIQTNPVVAEAMAYAAKPLLEGALNDVDREYNGAAILMGPDGEALGYSKGPGVVLENGRDRPYSDMLNGVERGHIAASDVEVKYYDRMTEIRNLRRRADQLARDAEKDL